MSKQSEDLVVWNCDGEQLQLAARCGECDGAGRTLVSSEDYHDCDACAGLGWYGIDPKQPVMAHAGSAAKVAMLTARYATGAPLWHPQDGCDAEFLQRQMREASERRPLTAAEAERRRESRGSRRRLAGLAT